MSFEDVRVKEELNWEEDYMYKEASAESPSRLYDDHDIKPDLVVGPEILQTQYVVNEHNLPEG